MATIKSFTDISQSKKLAEILPLESADFGWNVFVDDTSRILPINDWDLTKDGSGGVKFFHAWSLSALLGVLPEGVIDNCYVPNIQKENGKYSIAYGDDELLCIADNPIDACVEMILKLHELNLL